jgi:hypothetical protein
MFAMYRARLAAINELRAAGIPDSSIDGGWEQRAMTQIDRCGFINYSPIHMYAKAPPAPPSPPSGSCKVPKDYLTPIVVPQYTVSFDPAAEGGPSRFPSITYRDWLWPRIVTFYIVHSIDPASLQTSSVASQ